MSETASGLFIPDFRDMLSRGRRWPEHCLYCRETDLSWEHVLADGLGGRLRAKILCRNHNVLVARAADEPTVAQMDSCTAFLGVTRQSRKPTTMRAKTDDGETLRVTQEGDHIRRRSFKLLEMAPSGKIRRAEGSLTELDDLKARGFIDEYAGNVVAILERVPEVTVSTSTSRDVDRGVLKTALHFVAGFVCDIGMNTAETLLPYILGDKLAGGEYVRTISLEGRFFPMSWPPQHRISSYPAGPVTYVTVLFFGLYAFNVMLPIKTDIGMRYIQPLVTDDRRPIYEENDHSRDFSWEDRLSESDMSAFEINLKFRHEQIMNFFGNRILRLRCRHAAERALKSQLRVRIPYMECYHAELQIEGFSSEQLVILMYYAGKLAKSGLPIWQLPADLA